MATCTVQTMPTAAKEKVVATKPALSKEQKVTFFMKMYGTFLAVLMGLYLTYNHQRLREQAEGKGVPSGYITFLFGCVAIGVVGATVMGIVTAMQGPQAERRTPPASAKSAPKQKRVKGANKKL